MHYSSKLRHFARSLATASLDEVSCAGHCADSIADKSASVRAHHGKILLKMPKKKGKKGKKGPAPLGPARDFTAIPALDGADGAVGVEQLQFARKVDAVKMAMAEDVIAASVASGERSLTLQGLALHALPDSLYSLAGLEEVNLEDNFIVPTVFDHLAEFSALKAVNLRKIFLRGHCRTPSVAMLSCGSLSWMRTRSQNYPARCQAWRPWCH